MPIKNLTLGICLLLAGNALASDVHYKVAAGDTFQSIAAKFHVSAHRILVVNELHTGHHLRPGHFLMIPDVPSGLEHGAAVLVPIKSTQYKIRNGDCDWTLARRYNIGVGRLHDLNPGVDWDNLKLGLEVNVPGEGGHAHAAAGKPVRVAAVKKAHRVGASQIHTIAQGENDWIVAHHYGIRLGALVALNPGRDLESLKPGDTINVPMHHGASIVRVRPILASHVSIKGDSVIIRREGGLHAEKVTTVDSGTQAELLVRDGNWYQLRFPRGTVGWVRGDHLQAVRETRIASIEEHRARRRSHDEEVVTRHYVAEAPHHHVAAVSHSHVVAVHHSHRIAGSHAGSPVTYASIDSDGDASDVLRKAESMRGVRYRWGMASRSGTDCSGFTQQVYRAEGIHLPRTSSDQATVGQRVTYGDLKPGDLVFFHTYGGRRVTHVGIYKGNGHFLHASSRGGHVQENSLSEGYYQHRLVGIRRVLKGKHHSSSSSSSSEHHSSSGSSDSAYPTDN